MPKPCAKCPYRQEKSEFSGVLTPISPKKQPKLMVVFGRFIGKSTDFKTLLGRDLIGITKTVGSFLGWDLRETYITSAQKCVTRRDMKTKGRREMMTCCGSRLRQEIVRVNPEVLITFGKLCQDMLIDDHHLTWVNSCHWLELDDSLFPWITLQHPSQLRREGGRARDVEILLHSVKLQLQEEWEPLWELEENEDE